MKCVYEKKRFVFEGLNDGDYVLVTNGMDDFSLYPAESFEEAEARINEMISETEKETVKRKAKYIFANAESVIIGDNVMSLSVRSIENIYSDEFEVEEQNKHFRLIGKNVTKEQAGKYDIIEKTINVNG